MIVHPPTLSKKRYLDNLTFAQMFTPIYRLDKLTPVAESQSQSAALSLQIIQKIV